MELPEISTCTVAVIGLGYVGLPLAVEFSKHFSVIGYDLNSDRIEELNLQPRKPLWPKLVMIAIPLFLQSINCRLLLISLSIVLLSSFILISIAILYLLCALFAI